MSQFQESGPDDQRYVRYLLGLLPDADAERLDELSITDDDVAWRLRAVENDLVDAYIRGALTGDTLQRFESFYLASPRRREKVKMAGQLLRAVDRPDEASTAPMAVPGTAWSAWRFAAAAALLIVAGGALLSQEMRLRNGRSEAQKQSAALERRTHALEQQLEEQRAASTRTVTELKGLRASAATPAQPPAVARPNEGMGSPSRALKATAIVLLPQVRAAGPIPTLSVPAGADHVTFDLQLESDDFSRYEVALKDPATNQIVWRSGQVATRPAGATPMVSVVVPAGMLKPQHYSLELIGRPSSGSTEVVGSYAVQIEPR